MTPSQFGRAKRAFVEVSNAPESERQRILDEICGDDPVVRAEAERLLALQRDAKNFLNSDAFQHLDLREFLELPPHTLLNGRYKIMRKMNDGGFSTIYYAEDDRLLDRPVVVKVLHAGEVTDSIFRHEIAALVPLEHQNIVPILDTGRLEDGRPFLVTKYIDGPTLRHKLANGPLAYDHFGILFRQMLDAVDAAHALQVFHLDLKPENIVIENADSSKERAVIIDFGIAAVGGEKLQGNAGTSLYMAPEQKQGEASAAADYYALARAGFEMLTGELPGENPEALLSNRRPDVPARLRRALIAGLSINPNERLGAFNRIRTELTRKSSARSALLFAAAFGIAALIGTSMERKRDGELPITLERVRPFTTDAGRERFPAFSPDGSHVYYAASQDIDDPPDLYMRSVKDGKPIQLTRTEWAEERPVSSPDGAHVAFIRTHAGTEMAIVVLHLKTGIERVVARGDFHSLDWHPRVDRLLVSGKPVSADKHALYWLDVQDAREQLLAEAPDGARDIDPRFSPDGSRLVFVRQIRPHGEVVMTASLDSNLKLIGPPNTVNSEFVQARSPVFSPSSRYLLFAAGAAGHRSIMYSRADGSGRAARLSPVTDSVGYLAISNSGNNLIFGQNQDDVNIWRGQLKGGVVVETEPVVRSTWRDEAAVISPAGDRLLFVSSRSGSEQLWVSKPDGSDPRRLTDTLGAISDAAWTPDSSRIVLSRLERAATTSYFIDPETGKSEAFYSETGFGGSRTASRDGKSVYISSARDGDTFQLFRLTPASGQISPVTSAGGFSVEESMDGKGIFFTKQNPSEGLWWLSFASGTPVRIADRVAQRAFCAARSGVYYQDGKTIWRYAHGKRQPVYRSPKPFGFGLSVSSDEKWLYFSVYDRHGTDLMLVDNIERR